MIQDMMDINMKKDMNGIELEMTGVEIEGTIKEYNPVPEGWKVLEGETLFPKDGKSQKTKICHKEKKSKTSV